MNQQQFICLHNIPLKAFPLHIHCSGMRSRNAKPGGDKRPGRILFERLRTMIERLPPVVPPRRNGPATVDGR